MSRDVTKLKVFAIADRLVTEVYRWTRSFPAEERYGLQNQIRRAAVSVPTNLVEGSTRNTQREYARFIEVAFGSAAEVAYLIRLGCRLGYADRTTNLATEYEGLARALNALQNSFRPKADASVVLGAG